MKNAFKKQKFKFPLLWNHPSFSLARSYHDLAIRELIPLLYPGFVGFLVFHLLYHLVLFLVAKRSGRWDYLMIWGLFLMFNLLYDSF